MFRRHLGSRFFTGLMARDAKAEIMDENPGGSELVSQRAIPGYHSALHHAATGRSPLLPPLPEELEYRFIGDR